MDVNVCIVCKSKLLVKRTVMVVGDKVNKVWCPTCGLLYNPEMWREE